VNIQRQNANSFQRSTWNSAWQ